MIIISIIMILACVGLLYRRKGYSRVRADQEERPQSSNIIDPLPTAMPEQYNHMVIKERKQERKTYLSGFLRGKYWGERAEVNGLHYQHEVFYHFHIYEADVYVKPFATCVCLTPFKDECSGLHTETEGKFANNIDAVFPKERLPRLLPIIIIKDELEYAANIHEPQLTHAHFISHLHQTEGKEVFGTIEANITGFLLDFTTEEYEEPEYLNSKHESKTPVIAEPVPVTHAARHFYQPSYRYRYSRYNAFVPDDGCVSAVVGILAIIVWGTFLIAMLPQVAIILPFIAVPLLFRLLPAALLKWALRIAGLCLFAGFSIAMFSILKHGSGNHSVPLVRDRPSKDDGNGTRISDSAITHHLQWKSYEDKEYQGEISVSRAALYAATRFKGTLAIPDNSRQGYDELIYRIKEHDKNHLSGVYRLFDSIRAAEHLKADKFSELIVAFVQQIPYTVVLPQGCNASLYADRFIKHYLASPGARCDGYEKFGINTPVEFMAGLNGDCDTRTLLLYTLLSHYKYDVALLSSEYYNHSLIGINLPYSGATFWHDSKAYVLWETTASGIRPGVLPNEISNLNYWRISLKSEL